MGYEPGCFPGDQGGWPHFTDKETEVWTCLASPVPRNLWLTRTKIESGTSLCPTSPHPHGNSAGSTGKAPNSASGLTEGRALERVEGISFSLPLSLPIPSINSQLLGSQGCRNEK